MSYSSFTPVNSCLYEVIPGRTLILRSPTHYREVISSPITITEDKKKRKRWTKELREKAVVLGKEVGLSKATRILQQTPEYKELCSSTLYYWLKSNESKPYVC